MNEVAAWLAELAANGETPPWADSTRIEVARHLLAALRDFGILTGAVRKEFSRSSLSIAGFGYVAFRLHETWRILAGIAGESGVAPMAAGPGPGH